jgi:hypothetical protein
MLLWKTACRQKPAAINPGRNGEKLRSSEGAIILTQKTNILRIHCNGGHQCGKPPCALRCPSGVRWICSTVCRTGWLMSEGSQGGGLGSHARRMSHMLSLWPRSSVEKETSLCTKHRLETQRDFCFWPTWSTRNKICFHTRNNNKQTNTRQTV